MEVPLSDFNLLDLDRELNARALSIEGSKVERYERLNQARIKEPENIYRPEVPEISKYGATVHMEDFTEVQNFTQPECTRLTSKVHWRLNNVRRTEDGEGLEYFYPDVLSSVEHSKTYMLNMDEFLVRQEPYVMKMFVIFSKRTTGEEQTLCYARCLSAPRSWDENTEEFEFPLVTNDSIANEDVDIGILQTTLMTPANIAKALGYILIELSNKAIDNYVTIVSDHGRFNMPEVVPLIDKNLHIPHLLYDIHDLQRSLQNMFSTDCVRCSMRVAHELFDRLSYEKRLRKICNSKLSKNPEAESLLMEYVNKVPLVMRAMWKFKEHREKCISLLNLNNKLAKLYGAHVQSQLPPITYDDCQAGAGLLQLMVFDALWNLTVEREPIVRLKEVTQAQQQQRLLTTNRSLNFNLIA
ncbi:maker8 [Drosophila busckii]|uniref:Maker8 n=1 Tax=Drosophila busckii TaxID=30019 RepID=A0A0M4E7J7_DROBS|nr:uncharacterized protein LOC108595058 [Drosophila busckii]ALC40521.1 maker8 [Drosophila busckii]